MSMIKEVISSAMVIGSFIPLSAMLLLLVQQVIVSTPRIARSER